MWPGQVGEGQFGGDQDQDQDKNRSYFNLFFIDKSDPAKRVGPFSNGDIEGCPKGMPITSCHFMAKTEKWLFGTERGL